MKKICWIQHASEWPLYIPLAQELKQMGIDSVFVCKTRTVYEKYLSAGFETYFISEIFQDTKVFSAKELSAIDKKYGPPGMDLIGDSDVQLKMFFKDSRAKHQLVAKAYRFWEVFFNTHNDVYVIARETATFATRTAYNVARKRSIPYGWIDYGPADDTFVICDVSEYYTWSELEHEKKQEPRELSAEEVTKVRTYIESFVANSDEKKPIRFVPGNFFKSIKTIFGYTIRNNRKNRATDPVWVASLMYGRRKLLKRINWSYITQIFLKYDEMLDEKFVYYPIYSGDEAGYLTSEHFWARNQLMLIKEIAQSLPTGYTLYIKEHPWNPGEFLFSELKALKKIENVKIIHPRVNGQILIKNAQAVVVLQSFTGWEAYLHKKPVVVLGSAFYAFPSIMYRVQNVTDLPRKLWEALTSKEELYEKRNKEWLWSIHAIINSCHTGMFVNKKPPYGFPGDRKNARQMATSIHKKLHSSKFPHAIVDEVRDGADTVS